MEERITDAASGEISTPKEGNHSLSQYLSLQFYKENLDHLSHLTRDSINNFLKTISEIEDEFVTIMRNQDGIGPGLHDTDVGKKVVYMEENY